MKPIAVILIISLAASVAVCAALGNFWLLAPIFLGAAAALSLLFWLVLWLFSIFIPNKIYSEPSKLYLWLLNLAYAYVCEGARLKIHVSGLEKLPESPFVLVSNHASNLDNMVQCLALKDRPMAFIAKEELFRIPIVRGMITRCCYISIDRKTSKRGKPAIETAEDYLRRGVCCIGVYPEGHRNKGGELGKFHAGSFKIAVNTQTPIVVTALVGTEDVKHHFPFRRTHVYFDILEVVSPVGRKSTELAQNIQQRIADHITERKEANR